MNPTTWIRPRPVPASYVNRGRRGHPARVIAQSSADHDLLIIASHGRSGLSRFFLGSVTDKVIRLCPVPVLVVGDEAALLPLERILVSIDLSLNSESAFPLAREIADATGAVIELLYVRVCEDADVVAADVLEKRVRAFAGRHFEGTRGGIEVSAVVTGASAHEEIYRWVQAKKCNLIVMATAGKSGTDHVLLGSTPVQVVREVQAAVLLVNPEHYRGLKLAALEAG